VIGPVLSKAEGALARPAPDLGKDTELPTASESRPQKPFSATKHFPLSQYPRPGLISSRTLRLTAAGLANMPEPARRPVFTFLLNSGIDEELLSTVRTWIGTPIEFHSVFLSHSSLDKAFARKLSLRRIIRKPIDHCYEQNAAHRPNPVLRPARLLLPLDSLACSTRLTICQHLC
jgi:hypothetical protein